MKVIDDHSVDHAKHTIHKIAKANGGGDLHTPAETHVPKKETHGGESDADIKFIEKTLNADKIVEETQGAKATEAEDALKGDKGEVDRLTKKVEHAKEMLGDLNKELSKATDAMEQDEHDAKKAEEAVKVAKMNDEFELKKLKVLKAEEADMKKEKSDRSIVEEDRKKEEEDLAALQRDKHDLEEVEKVKPSKHVEVVDDGDDKPEHHKAAGGGGDAKKTVAKKKAHGTKLHEL